MATYAETITQVRDWSDRDNLVLPDVKIKKFLEFAADKAYRTLRVPALETSADFTVTNADLVVGSSNIGTEVSMSVPNDLIEILYIQKKGQGVVWNQKVDQRTFHDRYADKTNWNFYTRVGNKFLLHGDINIGDVLQVHYYKRLGNIDGAYAITVANYLSQTTTGIKTMTALASSSGTSTELFFILTNSSGNRDIINGISGTRPVTGEVAAASGGSTTNGIHMEPEPIAHWLRDENERVLLYGALSEAYDYLEETELGVKFEKKFYDEIERLNIEEQKRIAKGGNVSINFSGNGLI